MGAKRGQRVVRIEIPVGSTTPMDTRPWGVSLPLRSGPYLWPFTLNHAAAYAGTRGHPGDVPVPWSVTVTPDVHTRVATVNFNFELYAERTKAGLTFAPEPYYQDAWMRFVNVYGTNDRTMDMFKSWMGARAFKRYVFNQEDVTIARFVYPGNWREVLASEAVELYMKTARERLDRNNTRPPAVEFAVYTRGNNPYVAMASIDPYFVVIDGEAFEMSYHANEEHGVNSYIGRYRDISMPKGTHLYSRSTTNLPVGLKVALGRRRLEREIEVGFGA